MKLTLAALLLCTAPAFAESSMYGGNYLSPVIRDTSRPMPRPGFLPNTVHYLALVKPAAGGQSATMQRDVTYQLRPSSTLESREQRAIRDAKNFNYSLALAQARGARMREDMLLIEPLRLAVKRFDGYVAPSYARVGSRVGGKAYWDRGANVSTGFCSGCTDGSSGQNNGTNASAGAPK
jgi:hypothetical protein